MPLSPTACTVAAQWQTAAHPLEAPAPASVGQPQQHEGWCNLHNAHGKCSLGPCNTAATSRTFMFRQDLLNEPEVEKEGAAQRLPSSEQQDAAAPYQSPRAGHQRVTEEDLVQWFRDQCYPGKEMRIGLEWEKFLVHPGTLTRAACHEVMAVLRGLVDRFGWQPVLEGEVLVSVRKDGHIVDYEPGGQLEFSGAPVSSVWDVAAQTKLHLEEVQEVVRGLGLAVLNMGFDPANSLADTHLMSKERAQVFWDIFPQIGKAGHDIIAQSCALQVSLDYKDEADMVSKLRVGLGLQPVAVALFACSPFKEGKATGFFSTRAQHWFDVDESGRRTGILPFVFEQGMGFDRYARYIMDVPMIVVRREGQLVHCLGQRLQDFMQGRLPAAPGEYATLADWQMHLGTTYPEVRLKGVLEMRSTDAGPPEMANALAAFWMGLLYSDSVLAAAERLVCSWSPEERDHLYRQVPKLGLKLPFRNGTLLDVARQAVAWARQGLEERSKGEEVFLEPLERIVDSGRCLAEEMLDEGFKGSWAPSADPQ